MPNVSAAFVALIDMAAALYLIMYMMMFAAALVLRRTQPGVKRTYRVPTMGLVAGVGFLAVRKPSWDMRTAEDKSVPVTHEADPPAGADPGSAPATRRRPDAASGPPQTG